MRFLLLAPVLLAAMACRTADKEPVDADEDGVEVGLDCNDTDASVGGPTTWYQDGDADGWGDELETAEACEAPEGYTAEVGDCDDRDPAVHPGATEDDCTDPTDYNCDGSVGYADADGDGWPACEDCDDSELRVNPDALEVCNEVDDDCDGTVDGAAALDASVWWTDADGDGYGDAMSSVEDCTQPEGTVDYDTDCDDTDAGVHPDAMEHCDLVDEDCDGVPDDDAVDATTWYADTDGDGHGDPLVSQATCDQPSGWVSDASDCDDDDASIHPGALETCDGADQDCDGVVDDDATDAPTWYADDDSDGFGDADDSTEACAAPAGYTASDTDCDDADASVHPGQYEVCNEVDDDCDGSVDEADAVDASTWYADADSDSYGDADSSMAACEQPSGYVSDATDCDDSDDSVFPAADEYCDGTDHDCDGLVDEDESVDASTWYIDMDGDGYGSTRFTDTACEAPSGYVSDGTDCDDLDEDINPDGSEVCNGEDDDCDGLTDDDDPDATGQTDWYPDADEDGYGDGDEPPVSACDAPSGYVDDDSDCDDADEDVNPGESELCDGSDNDCDGSVDEGLLGTGSACPAESCAEVLDDDASAADGDYWLDPAGTGPSAQYTCDMSTDGGGWTEVLAWDHETGTDTLTSFEALLTELTNTMGYWGDQSTYIQWCDYDANTDVMAYVYDVDVPNDGEVLYSVHYVGDNHMSYSGTWFWVEAGGADVDLLCSDYNASGSSYYSSTEKSWLPSYTCATSTSDWTWNSTWQSDAGADVTAWHIASLHYDGTGSCGDRSRLYSFDLWVR